LERAIRTRRPSTNQREEGDLQREINHLEGSTHKWRRRKTPSRVTVINGAMSSTLMG
jgi:hypothetical protein